MFRDYSSLVSDFLKGLVLRHLLADTLNNLNENIGGLIHKFAVGTKIGRVVDHEEGCQRI